MMDFVSHVSDIVVSYWQNEPEVVISLICF